jgi:signal transduction histidine kinase
VSLPGVTGVLRRIVQVQAVLLVVLVLVSSVAVLSFRAADAEARRTEDVLVRLEALQSAVLSAETGLRGYLIVEQEDFLVPYKGAFGTIADHVTFLRPKLRGASAADLGEIEATMDEWRREFAEVALARQRADDEVGVLSLTSSGAGKRRTDRVRELVTSIGVRTRVDLDDQRADAGRRGTAGILAGGAAVAALVATSFWSRRRLQILVGDPLRMLAATAHQIGEGDLAARASGAGVAEVDQLASAFNAMAGETEATVAGLRELDRMKSEFVSVVSHELRTPLTSIRGSLGLVASGAMGELPTDAHEMLRIAVTNTDRLVRLINDILDLERIESGIEALQLAPNSLDEIVDEAVRSVEGTAQQAGITLATVPSGAVVQADHDRLVQAVTNLLANAVKFSDPGATVRVDAVERGVWVALRVIDQGRGIPAGKLESIFGRFQQVDASDAREKGGTGLGLAITQSIVERHGGRIEVTSEIGKGSTFTIALPLLQSPVPPAAPAPMGASVVLLVEDDLDLRDVLAASLGRHGVQVASATTAEAAVERSQQSPPDLLVLDVQLAGGSGFDVVRALRQDDRLREVPTVVYTVVDLTDEERQALRLGETVFVTKGQRTDERVEEIVLDLLRRRS